VGLCSGIKLERKKMQACGKRFAKGGRGESQTQQQMRGENRRNNKGKRFAGRRGCPLNQQKSFGKKKRTKGILSAFIDCSSMLREKNEKVSGYVIHNGFMKRFVERMVTRGDHIKKKK